MNNLHSDDLLKLAKKKNLNDVAAAQNERERKASSSNHLLAALGSWMIARGENLVTRHSKKLVTQVKFTHRVQKKAGA